MSHMFDYADPVVRPQLRGWDPLCRPMYENGFGGACTTTELLDTTALAVYPKSPRLLHLLRPVFHS